MEDKKITVIGATPSGTVSLWDRDAAHKDGEIFIVGGEEHEVVETPGVINAISEGRLTKVYNPKPAAATSAPTASAPQAKSNNK